MVAQLGRNFLISIYNDATYDDIVQARATDLTINNESVDITTKGSTNGWMDKLAGAGNKSISISFDGVYTDAAHEERLVTNAMGDVFDLYELTSGTGDKWGGTFQLTNYTRGGVQNGEETFSATLESSGEVVYTAS